PSEAPPCFSALHAPGGLSWLEGARGPDRRQSCRSGQMAPPTGRREDSAEPVRLVGGPKICANVIPRAVHLLTARGICFFLVSCEKQIPRFARDDMYM